MGGGGVCAGLGPTRHAGKILQIFDFTHCVIKHNKKYNTFSEKTKKVRKSGVGKKIPPKIFEILELYTNKVYKNINNNIVN